jgi:alpha/beta superfamily hydrolase
MVEGEEVTQQYVRFAGTALELEGILHLPKEDIPLPAVVVCHPHPLYGGDMDNNVVLAICEDLARASIAALRFNLRGVGRSHGDYSDGVGEQEDVAAALALLRSLGRVDPNKIGLAGYSFGTRVSLPVALQNDKVQAIALVSPFLTDTDWERLKGCTTPRLLLCGSDDDLVSCHKVKRWAGALVKSSQCEIIAGADHFWRGYEGQVSRRIAAFFEAVFRA